MQHATQQGYDVRFGWGLEDLHVLAPLSDAVVIVDVLRFTTAVSVAVDAGAVVLPYRWRDETARAFAREQHAELAGTREDPTTPWSLSPSDLRRIPAGTRLVLPSPNGSALTVAAAGLCKRVAAGCLRNGPAVGKHLSGVGVVTVIAAGERWPGPEGHHDGPLRPALEDLLGAGAVLDALGGSPSPEARAAIAAFRAVEDLHATLVESVSGRELLRRGWDDDIAAAAELGADSAVPVLQAGAYQRG